MVDPTTPQTTATADPLGAGNGQAPGAGAQADQGGAQQKAQEAAGQAKDKAQEAAGQAKEKAQEATQQAGSRMRQQVDERSTQAGEQVSSTAGDLRSVAEQLREQGKDTPARLAEQAAERTERVGGYLRDSDSDRILGDVEDFARRQPWAVVAGGVALGFAASRFLKASSSDRYRSRQAGGSPSPQPTPVADAPTVSSPAAPRPYPAATGAVPPAAAVPPPHAPVGPPGAAPLPPVPPVGS